MDRLSATMLDLAVVTDTSPTLRMREFERRNAVYASELFPRRVAGASPPLRWRSPDLARQMNQLLSLNRSSTHPVRLAALGFDPADGAEGSHRIAHARSRNGQAGNLDAQREQLWLPDGAAHRAMLFERRRAVGPRATIQGEALVAPRATLTTPIHPFASGYPLGVWPGAAIIAAAKSRIASEAPKRVRSSV
jgi:hypothetical protein